MFRPKYPDIVKPEYEAICGFHVRKVASFIAILGILSLIFYIPLAIMKLSVVRLISAFVSALFYAGILYADKYEKPLGYVPFLVAYGLSLIFGVVVIVASLVLILFPPAIFKNLMNDGGAKRDPEEPNFDRTTINLILTVIIISCIVGELIGLYIWNVVRRARKYMIDEVCSGKVERNFTTLESGNPSIEIKV